MGSSADDRDAVRRRRWAWYWDRHAGGYDRQMGFMDRILFGDTRQWICAQAQGRVLEVAIGTGLNLPHYPGDVELTGIELSAAMLDIARRRAAELGRQANLRIGDAAALANLRIGDAAALEFPDATFDTVVCTFSLCAIPDHHRAVNEMVRVLRPGGRLLLADHVTSTHPVIRAVQRAAERVTVPWGGEHFRRRPLELVTSAGLRVEGHDRFALGVVERLAARKA
jgi:ubiquinone/menaquinone biosynthesis C-methylase UbiE